MNKAQKGKKKDCFVIMPISVPQDMIDNKIYEDTDHFKLVYEHIIKPAIEENGWNPIYPKTKGSEIIIGDIIGNLINSEIVVCDISILNPNVFYESGIRTELNKPIAYIKDDAIEKIPFDTSGLNHETYRKSLKVDHVKEDITKLKDHFKDTYEKSGNENPAWKKFGIQITAEQPVATGNPINAKIDIILEKMGILENKINKKDIQQKSMNEDSRIKKAFRELFELSCGISSMEYRDYKLHVTIKDLEKVTDNVMQEIYRIGNKYRVYVSINGETPKNKSLVNL